MIIQQHIAVFAAALIYTGMTFVIIATPAGMTEVATLAIGFGQAHI